VMMPFTTQAADTDECSGGCSHFGILEWRYTGPQELGLTPLPLGTIMYPMAEGDVVAGVGAGVTLTASFPAGAVSEPVLVSIAISDGHPVPHDYRQLGTAFDVDAYTAMKLPVTEFEQ